MTYEQHAFPILERGESGLGCTYAGIALRDYFAAKALPALLERIEEFPDENLPVGVAWDAYRIADAMLIIRSARLAEQQGEAA